MVTYVNDMRCAGDKKRASPSGRPQTPSRRARSSPARRPHSMHALTLSLAVITALLVANVHSSCIRGEGIVKKGQSITVCYVYVSL